MAGHSRPKDGVASVRLRPAIYVLSSKDKKWMPATRPGIRGSIIEPQIIHATAGILRNIAVSAQLSASVPANTIAAFAPAGHA
jgi:hypothetical protein